MKLTQLLWPRAATGGCWRRNGFLVLRVHAGRVRVAWAVPLFLVDDLLDAAVVYGVLVALLLGRRRAPRPVEPWRMPTNWHGWLDLGAEWLALRLRPLWRQVRWSGPFALVDVRQRGLLVTVRLV